MYHLLGSLDSCVEAKPSLKALPLHLSREGHRFSGGLNHPVELVSTMTKHFQVMLPHKTAIVTQCYHAIRTRCSR